MRWNFLARRVATHREPRKLARWLWYPTYFVGLGLVCWFLSCSSGVQRASYDASKAEWTPIEGSAYVGEETCSACHEQRVKDFQQTVHGQASIKVEGEETHVSCENCHGPGGKHVDQGGDPRFILKGDSNNCQVCHREKKSEFRLTYHHPVPEGRMSCADCHTVHEKGGKSKGALLVNEKCISCHKEKRGPWTFEHEAMRDGCTVCHKPHGSMNNKLLSESDGNLCLKCHYNDATFQFSGHYGHRRAMNGVPNNCVKCHDAIHGSNFSKEFRSE